MNREEHTAIVGGMFPFPDLADARVSCMPGFWDDPKILVVNARSGMSLVIAHTAPRQVWMPSYLCPAMLDSLHGSRTQLCYYPVDFHLTVGDWSWLDRVRPGDLAIVIDYFGLVQDRALLRKIHSRGALVLEDASQALLSEGVGIEADFVVYSPRKFLGVPDGGILALKTDGRIRQCGLEAPPWGWWLKALRASLLRREYDLYGGQRAWFSLFREVEMTHPCGLYSMSELTRSLITTCFDYAEIARRRLENYAYLASRLREFALFPDLPQGTVPLGFPVRVRANRDQIRDRLFSRLIFPPVHWSIEGVVPKEYCDSHVLARQIMTIPCDQRYTIEDMVRVADEFMHCLA